MTARLIYAAIMLLTAACAVAPTVTPPPPPTPGPTVTPYPGQSIPQPPTPFATAPLVSLPDRTPLPPGGTLFFPLATRTPATEAPPGVNCGDVFPLDAVLRLVRDPLTIQQAMAAFGPVLSASGRPPRFRFEAEGCVLLVTGGMTYVQAAELRPYFTLGELLARLGEPEAVAEVPAGPRLPGRDRLALLYPAQGLMALFEGPPAALTDLIPQLLLVPPTDRPGLLDALGAPARLVEGWTPPEPGR